MKLTQAFLDQLSTHAPTLPDEGLGLHKLHVAWEIQNKGGKLPESHATVAWRGPLLKSVNEAAVVWWMVISTDEQVRLAGCPDTLTPPELRLFSELAPRAETLRAAWEAYRTTGLGGWAGRIRAKAQSGQPWIADYDGLSWVRKSGTVTEAMAFFEREVRSALVVPKIGVVCADDRGSPRYVDGQMRHVLELPLEATPTSVRHGLCEPGDIRWCGALDRARVVIPLVEDLAKRSGKRADDLELVLIDDQEFGRGRYEQVVADPEALDLQAFGLAKTGAYLDSLMRVPSVTMAEDW
jgi:hypothetical protein